jgi:hypothetical protein
MGKRNVGFLKIQEIFKMLSECYVSKVVSLLGKEFSCTLDGYSLSEGISV